MVFYAKCFEKKDRSGTYVALCADLGYTEKRISFNTQDIAEVCKVSVAKIAEMKVGEKIEVK